MNGLEQEWQPLKQNGETPGGGGWGVGWCPLIWCIVVCHISNMNLKLRENCKSLLKPIHIRSIKKHLHTVFNKNCMTDFCCQQRARRPFAKSTPGVYALALKCAPDKNSRFVFCYGIQLVSYIALHCTFHLNQCLFSFQVWHSGVIVCYISAQWPKSNCNFVLRWKNDQPCDSCDRPNCNLCADTMQHSSSEMQSSLEFKAKKNHKNLHRFVR